MSDLDMNLLVALDALLMEGSVTGAARRLNLSASAMSRTLARVRAATGDPLLVRAGRGMVPTPRAAELQAQVHELARDVRAALSPRNVDLDLSGLERTFTIRTSEGWLDLFSAAVVTAVAAVAPGVRLRFAPKPQKEAGSLREGAVDLDIGVLGTTAPELRTKLLFRDRFVGAARAGHPLLTGDITPERYAACRHVAASRRGAFRGPVDDALEELGLGRIVVAVVPGFLDALRIARQSDLVALVPRSCLASLDALSNSVRSFNLPVLTPEIAVSAMWHPRMDADPAHRWLRNVVVEVCSSASDGETNDANQDRARH